MTKCLRCGKESKYKITNECCAKCRQHIRESGYFKGIYKEVGVKIRDLLGYKK